MGQFEINSRNPSTFEVAVNRGVVSQTLANAGRKKSLAQRTQGERGGSSG
jgi:hypothetical protein